jgi:hypothetical protein
MLFAFWVMALRDRIGTIIGPVWWWLLFGKLALRGGVIGVSRKGLGCRQR